MARVEPVDNFVSNEGRRHVKVSDPGGGGSDMTRDPTILNRISAPGALIFRARQIARDMFVRSGWYESSTAVNIRKCIRGRVFAAIAAVSLFVALFMPDIFAVGQVSTNMELDIVLIIVFGIFALEFVGLSMTDASYLLGFFFWMDLLGTGSMVFDISFLAGQDVRNPDFVTGAGGGSSSNVVVVRATRAAKLGARAGRISRVLKILRFLPFLMKSDQDESVKMARVISNQLTNALSTRVAFLTICIVVITPLFTMFTYPEDDDSMSAWTEILAMNARRYHLAWEMGNSTLVDDAKALFLSEVMRLRGFYAPLTYGPFNIVYGDQRSGAFVPQGEELDLSGVQWTFGSPSRPSSIRIITVDRVQTYFNLGRPKVMEAASSIGLILFIILVMCVFGLIVSSSISVVALQPLERMLTVVRERCTQIFKYTNNLKAESEDDSDDAEEDYDDMQNGSEFVLLEKVVGKLAAIASLSIAAKEPEVTENMNENELLVLNWTQGAHVATTASATGARASIFPPKSSSNGGIRGTGSSCLATQIAAPIDETTRAESLSQIPKSVKEDLETADFCPLDLPAETRIAVGQYIVTSTSGPWANWTRTNVSAPTLWAFVSEVESNYKENAFHNFAHAVDVEYTVYHFMDWCLADRFLTETVQFCLLISALGHDIGHIGVNNQYLVQMGNELAVRYNDRSPLENMHCAKLFKIATAVDSNIFAQLDKDLYKEMRKSIIDVILHTDVTKHNDLIKDMGLLYQVNSEAFDSLSPETAIASQSHMLLIANVLLHGADVSNPFKPWELCKRYAYLCMEEFFAQGDLEKQAGVPVQMLNDREKVSRPNSQIGFIEFFIAPMVIEMVHLFPQFAGAAAHLQTNIQRWSDVWQEEASPAPDAIAKVAARVKKVADNMGAAAMSAEEHQQLAAR